MPEEHQTALSFFVDRMWELLPSHLRDYCWEPCLLIFLAVPALAPFVESYFDFKDEYIDIVWFNQAVAPALSDHEQFMASLAFHLFNGYNNPLPLGGLENLRGLDTFNFELALSAIRLSVRSNL